MAAAALAHSLLTGLAAQEGNNTIGPNTSPELAMPPAAFGLTAFGTLLVLLLATLYMGRGRRHS